MFTEKDTAQSIPDRFRNQVERFTGRTAVKSRGLRLTYEELDLASNRIANRLLTGGDGATPVALLLDHDAPVVAAILGVLKAGMIYVPLDASSPESRIATQLADAGAGTILTDNLNAARCKQMANGPLAIINIEEIGRGTSEDDPGLAISPDTPCYILYTSGSTGKPKGVVQSHRNVLHFTMRYTNAFSIHPGDRLSLLTSVGFGAAASNLFGALLNGASLMPFNLRAEQPEVFARWLAEEGITVYHTVPTVFRYLDTLLSGSEDFSGMRIIRLGGEPVTGGDVAIYKKHFPSQTLLVNSYGATEFNGISYYVIDHTTRTSPIMPIGKTMDDSEILLLGRDGREAGVEEIGEIVIQSPHLALGYWRKAEETRAAFKPIPQSENCRSYRTGDLGRMTRDGLLFHLGRKDRQIKIGGQRIEVAEIENALRSHPRIDDAAVCVSEKSPGHRRLSAHIVSRIPAKEPLDREEAVRFLRDRLPFFMIPGSYFQTASLPVLPNGKIDHQALLSLEEEGQAGRPPYEAPRTPIEKQLVNIWGQVLGIEKIGIYDNFFELGGDSLNGVYVLSQIQKKFGKRLSVESFYLVPTVEQLAGILAQEKWSPPSFSLVPIQTSGEKPPFFLVHGGVAFLKQFLGPGQPLYWFRSYWGEGTLPKDTTIKGIASRYLEEMDAVQPEGPYFLGGYSLGGLIAYEMALQLKGKGREIAMLFLLDPVPPLNDPESFHRAFSIHENSSSNSHPGKSKIMQYLSIVRTLETAETLDYLWIRVKGIKKKINHEIKKLFYRFYQFLGYPVPPRLQRLHNTWMYKKAKRNYVPGIYSNPASILLTNKHSKDLPVWKKLIGNDIEVYEISCNHRELLYSPYDRIWAERIKTRLAKAHAVIYGKRRSFKECAKNARIGNGNICF